MLISCIVDKNTFTPSADEAMTEFELEKNITRLIDFKFSFLANFLRRCSFLLINKCIYGVVRLLQAVHSGSFIINEN